MGINLTKEEKSLYTEQCWKHCWKKLKKTCINGKPAHAHGLEDAALRWKYSGVPAGQQTAEQPGQTGVARTCREGGALALGPVLAAAPGGGAFLCPQVSRQLWARGECTCWRNGCSLNAPWSPADASWASPAQTIQGTEFHETPFQLDQADSKHSHHTYRILTTRELTEESVCWQVRRLWMLMWGHWTVFSNDVSCLLSV